MKQKEKLLIIQSSSLCCIRFERADKESLKCRTKNRQKFAKTESEDKKSLTGFQIPGQEGTVNYKILNTAQLLVIKPSLQAKSSKWKCCQLLHEFERHSWVQKRTATYPFLPEFGGGWDLGSRESAQTWSHEILRNWFFDKRQQINLEES